VPQTSTWKAPPEGWAKLNSDASYDMITKEATAGCVIRNCKGEVLLSAWSVLPKCTAAEEAEFLACEQGVKHALQWCDMPLVVEGDCSALADGLRDGSRNLSHYGTVLLEIKRLRNDLPDVVFCKTNRD
jgi:hypothetical protein